MTFDYQAARDGLALLTHGDNASLDAGYQASAAANPAAIWNPRYVPQGAAAKGGTDVFSGNYQFNADPEFAWSNHFTPFATDGNGDLRIRAQQISTLGFASGEVPIEPVSGQPYPYMSGLLSSKDRFSQQGGYWEVVAKMPHGTATWPAFWLIPLAETHPPEIDINEYVGQDAATTYRTNAISAGPTMHSQPVAGAVDLSADFYTYGVFWTDTTLTYYLDRVAMATVDIKDDPEFGQPFYALLNLQIGSRLSGWVPPPDGSTPAILDMLVRSMSVWQQPGPVGVNFSASSFLDTTPVGGVVCTLTSGSFGGSTGQTFTLLAGSDPSLAVTGNTVTVAQVVSAKTSAARSIRVQVMDSAGRTQQRLLKLSVVSGATATNLLPTSDLTSDAWNKEGVTATAPNVIMETTASGGHDVIAAAAVAKPAGATRFAFTVRATPNLSDGWVQVQVFASTGGATDFGTTATAWFNVASSAVGYSVTTGNWSGGVAATATPLSGGQVLLSMTWAAGNETGLVPLLRLAKGQDQTSYAGATTAGMTLDNVNLSVAQ